MFWFGDVMLWKKIKQRLHFGKKNKRRIRADLSANTVDLPPYGSILLDICGKNNTVHFPENMAAGSKIKIKICGENNVIDIKSAEALNLDIKFGDVENPIVGGVLSIGERTQIGGLEIYMFEDDSKVSIGADCLFSWNISLWCTDTHTVTDLDGRPQNRGRSVVIGDHVWVGRDVHIAKNTAIAPHSIVGWCSNVVSEFAEPHTVVAGNPAKVVKRNVDWSHLRFNEAMRRFSAKNPSA